MVACKQPPVPTLLCLLLKAMCMALLPPARRIHPLSHITAALLTHVRPPRQVFLCSFAHQLNTIISMLFDSLLASPVRACVLIALLRTVRAAARPPARTAARIHARAVPRAQAPGRHHRRTRALGQGGARWLRALVLFACVLGATGRPGYPSGQHVSNDAFAAPITVAPAAAAPVESLDRTTMYEELYSKHNYHADLRLTHAQELVQLAVLPYYRATPVAERKQTLFLDVGCSHGRGVQMLWQQGFCAHGVDLAPTAVAMANKVRRPPDACRNASMPFFQTASAAELPFGTGAFAAILSTDVLEHLPRGLVPGVVAEFTRVATDALFLQIAKALESKSSIPLYMNKLSKQAHQADQLHETVEDGPWWKAQFEAAGAWSCAVKPPPRKPDAAFWMQCTRVTSGGKGGESKAARTLRAFAPPPDQHRERRRPR